MDTGERHLLVASPVAEKLVPIIGGVGLNDIERLFRQEVRKEFAEGLVGCSAKVFVTDAPVLLGVTPAEKLALEISDQPANRAMDTEQPGIQLDAATGCHPRPSLDNRPTHGTRIPH